MTTQKAQIDRTGVIFPTEAAALAALDGKPGRFAYARDTKTAWLNDAGTMRILGKDYEALSEGITSLNGRVTAAESDLVPLNYWVPAPLWDGTGEPSPVYPKFAVVFYSIGPTHEYYACSKHADNTFEPPMSGDDSEHWWMAPTLPALISKVAHALQSESEEVRGHVTHPARALHNWWDPTFPFEFPAHSGKENCLTPIRCRSLERLAGDFDPAGCVLYLAAAVVAERNTWMPSQRDLGFVARIFADGEANYIRMYSSTSDAVTNTNVRAFGSITSGTSPAWILLHLGDSATNDTFGWLYAPNGFGADVTDADGTRWPFRMMGEDFAFRPELDAVPGKTFVIEAAVNLDMANVDTGGEPSGPVSIRPQVTLGRWFLNDEDGESGGFDYDFPIDTAYSGAQHCRIRATVTVIGVDEEYIVFSTRLQILDAQGIDTEKSVLERVYGLQWEYVPALMWFGLNNRITFGGGTFDLVVTSATMKVLSGRQA